MSKKQILILAAAFVVLALAGGAWLYLGHGASTGNDAARVTAEEVALGRTLGDPNAPVTMIEYASYICPYCANFNNTVMPEVKKKYIDTGKVYYVLRLFPRHAADVAAEKMATCLAPAQYFQFVDTLFRNQPKWDPEYGVPDVHAGLVQMGRIAGLSAEKTDQCINDTKLNARIMAVQQTSLTAFNVGGTPTIILNGKVVADQAPSWEQMQKLIDTALAK